MMANIITLGIKKKSVSFVLLSIFRNIAITDGEVTHTRNKKQTSLFCSSLVFP